MKLTIFNGTPEEYLKIAHVLGKEDEKGNPEPGAVAIKDAYRAMLRRGKIHRGQRDLYRTLAAGEMAWTDYVKKMGRSMEEIRGVHGALGRRINNTSEIHQAGLPGKIHAVIYEKDNGHILGLKPDFIEVLKEEGLA